METTPKEDLKRPKEETCACPVKRCDAPSLEGVRRASAWSASTSAAGAKNADILACFVCRSASAGASNGRLMDVCSISWCFKRLNALSGLTEVGHLSTYLKESYLLKGADSMMIDRECDRHFCECSDDGKHLLIHDRHEGCNVCSKCGIVVGAVANDTPDWFEPEKARASCDAFTTAGKPTSLMNKMNMSINQKKMQKDEGHESIEALCVTLGLHSTIADRAVQYLHIIQKKKGLWRGVRRIALRAACVSLACQEKSVGIKDDEICANAMINIKAKILNKQKKFVICTLHQMNIAQNHQRDASEYCMRFCNALGIDRRSICSISRKVSDLQKCERLQSKPAVMLAAAVVIRAMAEDGYRMDRETIVELTGVTIPTVIKWYADINQCSVSVARKRVLG